LGFLTAADVVAPVDPLGPAIALAIALRAQGHVPPPRDPTFTVAGDKVCEQLLARESQRLSARQITPHQLEVNRRVATVLCGGEEPGEVRSEADLFALERRHFIALLQTAATQARIGHVRSTGKLLVN
jgi:3-hydroxyacyl-CoA dehydrogenase